MKVLLVCTFFVCILLVSILLVCISIYLSRENYYQPRLILEPENDYEHDYEHDYKPVDIVITWVDSSDIQWQNSKKYYYKDTKTDNENIRFPDPKFTDIELETTILLILKNIRWHGNIYIVVADGQIPNCYNKLKNINDNIHIVNHSEIWPKNMLHTLPTFNSHAIECNIHRINNLSNNFIYFNDDMYVIKNLKYDTMFYKNKMVIQPLTNKPPKIGKDNKVWHKVWRNMHKMYNMYSPFHYCYALNKNVMFSAEQLIYEHWNKTIATRFRSSDNVAPIGYTINFALKNLSGYLTRDPLKCLLYHDEKKIVEYPKNTNADIICINETSDIYKSITSLRENCL
jgi:hypothetical protein